MIIQRTWVRFFVAWSLLVSTALTQEMSVHQKDVRKQGADVTLEQMVVVNEGQLPIIISAPHGGLFQIPNVEARQGKGMETGPKGFFIGRDGGTEELANDIVKAIETKFGRRPYSVILLD